MFIFCTKHKIFLKVQKPCTFNSYDEFKRKGKGCDKREKDET